MIIRRLGTVGLPFVAAALVLATGSAFAQGQDGERPERPLRGPQVEQRPAQMEQRFSEPMGRQPGAGQAQRGQGIRHPEFMAVVWMLGDEEAPDELRLTKEQTDRIATIDREFQDKSRDHGERLRELARGVREGAEPGERQMPRRERQGDDADATSPSPRGPAGQPQGRRLSDEDRERIEQLRQAAPRPVEAQTKIFAELNATQKAFVEEELEYRREVMERQRNEEMMRRRMAMQQGGPGGEGGFQGRGGPEAQAQRQQVGRIMMRLQQMPPEERERIVARLEQELERRAVELGLGDLPERQWGGRGGRGGEGGGAGGDGERRMPREGGGERRRPAREGGEGAPPRR